jgi:hypothetical protein
VLGLYKSGGKVRGFCSKVFGPVVLYGERDFKSRELDRRASARTSRLRLGAEVLSRSNWLSCAVF